LKRVTIIIVNYHVAQLLLSCIDSIVSSKTKYSYEIIVVDNDEKKTIFKDLKKRFPRVKYIRNDNRGFSHANNIGAKRATGDLFLFLNPDTLVQPNAINRLVRFLGSNKRVGVVAPLLLDRESKPYELQGTEVLTPLKSLFAYSFLNKILPNNPVSRNFWMKRWKKTKEKEVEVVPGTAFMIEKNLFWKIGGFDEKFFLYFEEYDLCKRVKDAGFKLFIIPEAKIMHYWGESTKVSNLDTRKIFEQSRFYYFKKNFGLFQTLVASFVLGINKSSILLALILLTGGFLRLNGFGDSVSLIADQEWFYSSAKSLLQGNVPLVGITSSQTWLHQGPLWTYMLSFALFISNNNPISGSWLTALLGLLSIFLIFKVGEKVNSHVGIIASFLYATSPLIVQSDRFAYHTSPIPLVVVLLIYALINWVGGKIIFFPFALFCMSLLYNFELATVVFWPVILILLSNGFLKKEPYFYKLLNFKQISLSIVGLLFPMIPILIYDITHSFLQTVKYAHWVIFLRIIKPIFTGEYNFGSSSSSLGFLSQKFEGLLIVKNSFISSFIILLSLCNVISALFQKRSTLVIALCTFIPLLGFIFNNVLSDAYLPMLFPGIVLVVAILFSKFTEKLKNYPNLIILTLILVLALFLRLYRIDETFIFSSEIGDNLLAIKNAYFGGYIPLVGPPTSHAWLDFGPLYYYLYGPVLILSNFNPLSHVYFGVFISILTIAVNYYIVAKLFSSRIALISSFLLALSPSFIGIARVARFFSIIPLLLYFYIYILFITINGSNYYFLLGFILGIAINFHYSVLILIPISIFVLFLNKKLNLRNFLQYLFGMLIPLIPLLIHDLTNNFKMTLSLVAWVPYRIVGSLGLYPKNNITSETISADSTSFIVFLTRSITADFSLGLMLMIVSLIFFVGLLFKFKKRLFRTVNFVLALLLGVGLVTFFMHGKVPNHYFIVLFPAPIIIMSLLLDSLWRKRAYVVVAILFLVAIVNINHILNESDLYKKSDKASIANIPYALQLEVSEAIIKDASGEQFQIKRIGPLDFFENNYSQNYSYLLWWLGNEPLRRANTTYVIVEENYPYTLQSKKVANISNIEIYKEK